MLKLVIEGSGYEVVTARDAGESVGGDAAKRV